ncbi:MAG: hypothetical protein COA69_03090 [Robiginitomaculum sp.]|nr:MAG: hypothetical protein COA69_03090 [Robiginitomaculum sp.]
MYESIGLPNDFEEYAKNLSNAGAEPAEERLNNLLRLDISVLNKEGVLSNHVPVSMTILQSGNPIGAIQLQACHNFLCIQYPNAEQTNTSQQIVLEKTPCHYGGTRKWFLCPDCDKRVGILYWQDHFKCRHCTKLHYVSQYQCERTRLFARARKIRRSLDGSENLLEPLPKSPKGMHITTYLRLLEEYVVKSSKALSMVKR